MKGYTDMQLIFIYFHRDMLRSELAKVFNARFRTNKSASAIQCVCTRYRWNRPSDWRKGFVPHNANTYSKKQLRFLSDNRTMPRADLTTAFNKKFGTDKKVAAIASICKSRGYETGRTGCFEKGNVPANKGMKGLTGPNSGSFKKGDKPKNWKPVGSERICTKDGYVLIKTAEPRVWRHKHTVVWEEAHGPIGKDEVITFKDGNILNLSLDNLVKITRRELLWLNQNGYKECPPEYRDTLRTLAKMNVKAFKLKDKITAKTK